MQHNTAPETYYDILDVSPQADDNDIKLAYRRLVLFWHPDRRIHTPSIAEENLKRINEAYSHIKTKQARAKYNQILQLQQKGTHYSHNTPTRQTSMTAWGQFMAWMTKTVRSH